MHPDIAAHIAQFPPTTQVKLKQLHGFICEQIPTLTQKIGYGIPTFLKEGKNFIHYAGYSKHIGLYPGAKAISYFSEEFKRRGLKYSKGTVQFALKEDLPLNLIAQILKYLNNK